jgi:hypothetical protein
MRCATAFIGLSFVMFVSVSRAQESGQNGPVVVPDMLQQIAVKFPIAERLGIKWDSATVGDVGRYMGFLAGVNVVAIQIAGMSDRSSPTNDDYVAALSAQCMFPPNKPPFVEPYWSQIYPAFYSATTRNKLRQAVGPQAVAISKAITKYGLDGFAKSFNEYLPTEQKQYFQNIFDPTKLK